MELKHVIAQSALKRTNSFNRTFMELKHISAAYNKRKSQF